MKLLALFFSFLQIGLFSIGGGYAAMPLIQEQVVNLHGWLTIREFADLVTIAEMTPGPIAINAATFVGTRISGIGGAIIATLGFLLPSCILVCVLYSVYRKWQHFVVFQTVLATLRPVVVALIAGACLTLLLSAVFPQGISLRQMDFVALGIFILALLALKKWKLHPILVIFLSGGLGLLLYIFF